MQTIQDRLTLLLRAYLGGLGLRPRKRDCVVTPSSPLSHDIHDELVPAFLTAQNDEHSAGLPAFA